MRLRIGSRMMGGFLLMSILLIVAGIVAIRYLDRLENSSSRILTENVVSLKAAEELEIALLDMKGLTGYYLLDGNPRWLTIFEEKHLNCLHWLPEAREGAYTTQEKQIVSEIDALLKAYLKYQSQTVAAYDRGERQAAYRLLSQEMLSTFLLIYDKCEDFLAINEALMFDASRRIEDENRTARRIMYGVGGIGLVLGVFLGILLARSVTLPIYELVLKVRGATHDELVEKVDIVNETELDHLNRHVRGLIDKIYDTNRDLEESRRMLLQSEKLAALGQVAAGLAHEIHNPLAAIKMLLFSVRQEVQATPQIEKDFEVMTREIARMERFIQNFLQFARPHRPVVAAADVHAVLEDALALLNPQLNQQHIAVEKQLMPDPPLLQLDAGQIQQVLINLILNAIQAMPDSGRLVIESALERPPLGETPMLRISLRDSGSGIAPEVLENLFDPFVTTRSRGTGLGLSIAYRIIKQHGGWIEAFNNPDKGATFKIFLPLNGGNADVPNSGD